MSGLIRNSMATAIIGSFLTLVVVTAPSVTWALDVSAPKIPTSKNPCGAQGGGGKQITSGDSQCGAQGGGGKKSKIEESGAGNTSGRTQASLYDINQAIIVSKFALKLALNGMMGSDDVTTGRNRSLYARILIRQKNLYKDLKDLNIRPQKEPCEYPVETETTFNEASINGNEVCISYGKINDEKYSLEEVLKKVTGLLGHEFAHKRGISYKEDRLADIFRDKVEIFVSTVRVSDYLTRITNSNILQFLDNAKDAYQNFRLNAETNNFGAICAASSMSFAANAAILWAFSQAEASAANDQADVFLSQPNYTELIDSILRPAAVVVSGCGMSRLPNTVDLSAFAAEISQTSGQSLLQMFQTYVRTVNSRFYDQLNQKQREMFDRENQPSRYERNMCGFSYEGDCWGMRTRIVPNIKVGDIETMKQQMQISEEAQNKMKIEVTGYIGEAMGLQREITHVQPIY